MEVDQIILELKALELYFEEGRKRCYSIRKHLEQFSAPAPSGESIGDENSQLIEILSKRKKSFYKGGVQNVEKSKKSAIDTK